MADEPNPPDDLTYRTTSTYDGAGRVTAARDPAGPVTWMTYDAHDPGTTVPYPPGRTTWTRYDADGRVIDRGTGPRPPGHVPDDPPDEPHIVG